ncbi:MAG: ShlB/FhaC/HecB family hemolysin secretion/activation protein [Pseudomonadota bacterium]
MNKKSRIRMAAWQTLLSLVTICCSPVMAQSVEQVERGGVDRPKLPEYQQPEAPGFVLPPLAPMQEQGKPSEGASVMVRGITLEGYSPEFADDLRQIVSAYEHRVLSSDDLQRLRHELTLYYVERGYINSGAVLPDQEVTDGTVAIRIIEGRLNQIEVSGNVRLKPGYISQRIELGAVPPLNVNELQQRLQLLQQGGLIERVNAELLPGVVLGESALKVAVKEALPYQIVASFSNHRSPSVGAYRPELYGVHHNVSGRGDTAEGRYGFSSGLDDYLLGYALPLNARDTTLSLRYSKSDSSVVEEPFANLDIQSQTITKSIGLSHPLRKTLAETLALDLTYERRASNTSLLGVPFSFSAGIPDGKSEEDVWRFSQSWLSRSPDQVVALRSTISSGSTNALPRSGNIGPEKHFLTWLGQFQWARRMANHTQLIARLDVQATGNALLPMDKFGLGGANSVRGYRENQLLRDKGYVASVEYRIPVLADENGVSQWQIAPFVDYGRGWNADGSIAIPDSISSGGVGLLWNQDRRVQAQLYVARAFRKVDNAGHDLQDSGIHFLISYQFL